MYEETNLPEDLKNLKKRKFLNHAILGMGVFGVGSFLWMLTRAVNTSHPTQIASDLKVDLNQIPEGKTQTILFKGSPLSLRHRTKIEMKEADKLYGSGLRDPYANNQLLHEQVPATNANRSIAGNSVFILVVGTCTNKDKCGLTPNAGSFNGWYCSCCASHYDIAGRIIKGVAPRNLSVPRYRLADNNILHILA